MVVISLPVAILKSIDLAGPFGMQEHLIFTVIFREIEFISGIKWLNALYQRMIGFSDFNPIGFNGRMRQKLAAQYLHKILVVARCPQQRWIMTQPLQHRVGRVKGKPFATLLDIGFQSRLPRCIGDFVTGVGDQ